MDEGCEMVNADLSRRCLIGCGKIKGDKCSLHFIGKPQYATLPGLYCYKLTCLL